MNMCTKPVPRYGAYVEEDLAVEQCPGSVEPAPGSTPRIQVNNKILHASVPPTVPPLQGREHFPPSLVLTQEWIGVDQELLGTDPVSSGVCQPRAVELRQDGLGSFLPKMRCVPAAQGSHPSAKERERRKNKEIRSGKHTQSWRLRGGCSLQPRALSKGLHMHCRAGPGQQLSNPAKENIAMKLSSYSGLEMLAQGPVTIIIDFNKPKRFC